MSRLVSALAQIDEIREVLISRHRFRGYSGVARLIGGVVAIAAAAILSAPFVPASPEWHAFTWIGIGAFAAGLNYGALAIWYFRSGSQHRRESLRPALDALAPLLAAVVLTFTMMRGGVYALLPGVWMCLFGLMHTSSVRHLPRLIGALGWFYLACGTLYLIQDNPQITTAWWMGAVFFVGEIAGGIIFISSQRELQRDPDFEEQV